MRVPNGFTSLIQGIDVSAWQGKIDWKKVYKEAGPGTAWNLHFVGIKCGESTYRNPDKYWSDNWQGAQDAGFAHRIAYHFFHPNVSARDQANLLIERIQKEKMRGTDAVALDFEKQVGILPSVIHDCALQFIELVQNALLTTCIVYTGAWYADGIVKAGSPLSKQPLWVASYTDKPRMPVAWKSWDLWQYGAEGYGPIPGIDVGDNVDHNLFRSESADALRSFFLSLRIFPSTPAATGQNNADLLAQSLVQERQASKESNES